MAPAVSIGSFTATVDPPLIPPPDPQGEGGTSSAQTKKKTKETFNVWNDFELSIRI